LDLSKPLSWGKFIKLKDKSIWVFFRYEKIPTFCCNCGVIRHGNKGCIAVGIKQRQGRDNGPEFGPWLRVMSPKRRYGGNSSWDQGARREANNEECNHQSESEQGDASSGFNGMGGGRNSTKPVTPLRVDEGISGFQKGSGNPIRAIDDRMNHSQIGKKKVMARNLGEDFLARNKPSQKVTNEDSSQYRDLGDPISESCNEERNNEGPPNIYVGQWD
jgi:hypothetical protein